jgi:DNA-binding NarL/FixJ family response regulator
MSLGHPSRDLEQEPAPLRVLIADDHAPMRRAAIDALGSECEMVAELDRGDAVVTAAAATDPDIIVLDITMPGLDGIEATRRLVSAGSTAKIIILTVHSDPALVRAALESGATGYVVKSRLVQDLLEAVRLAMKGQTFVSPGIGSDAG